MVVDSRCPTQPVLGVLSMKKTLLAGVAALFLATGAAHAREWQGNMPRPIGKLPSYPPIVCVTPNWTPEPCESRRLSDAWEDVGKALGEFFKWLEWTKTNWLGTVLIDYRPENVGWPKHTTVLYSEPGGILYDYIKRWQDLAKSGDDVEIRDLCASACTLIIAYVPRERICFGKYSSLLFHAVRKAPDMSIDGNRWLDEKAIPSRCRCAVPGNRSSAVSSNVF